MPENTENTTVRSEADIDAELAQILADAEQEERHPVLLVMPNGMMVDGQPMMVQQTYFATLDSIMHAQALLERGTLTSVPDVVKRTTDALVAAGISPDAAHDAAAHLAELDMLK